MSQTQFKIHPVKNAKGGRSCRFCRSHRGLIRKYKLNMCRRCFREQAPSLGFVRMD
eukprot:GAHX01002108.1.p1 GENE.GAHX01002108.1~~GAHX01002108.1.p1  ORF type:complete len:56 (-),score=6.67 GAHX01002108.1:57-224(-)